MVQTVRRRQPCIGGRKLYYLLGKELVSYKMGRDKFFELLRDQDLLVKRKKSYIKTTQSYHRFKKYKNKLKQKVLTRAEQVYVSDITYLRTEEGFVYLSLITDAYSRKIVGWNVSESLSIEGCIAALKMAARGSKAKGIIHHSDRGIQYCSHEYVRLAEQKYCMEISMTEENHCYENSLAERVNGILKDAFLLDSVFKNKETARRAVGEAVKTYNVYRPHWSLNLQTPHEVHKLEIAA